MKLIYIAGPYTAPTRWGVADNTHQAKAAAREVIRAGHMPVVPHVLGTSIEDEADADFWYAGTLEVMRRCDAVLLFGEYADSTGAKAEEAEAMALGIPVFDHIVDLTDWFEAGQ